MFDICLYRFCATRPTPNWCCAGRFAKRVQSGAAPSACCRSRVRRVYHTQEFDPGGIYSHPYPPTGHASAAGRARFFQVFPSRSPPEVFSKIFWPHLGAKMAPKIANLAEIVHLVPLLAASWAQYRPTWSPRCPNKPQDARIAKNLQKPKENQSFYSPSHVPKCLQNVPPTPPQIVQVTPKMAPKPPKLTPRWPS